MRVATIMADRVALYRLMSWLSPSYPVGGFAYSHGLEYAVDRGRVADADALAVWIEAVLIHGTGRIDGVLFRETHRATVEADWQRLEEVAALGAAFQPSAEIALESRSQGDAFLGATRVAWPAPVLDRLADIDETAGQRPPTDGRRPAYVPPFPRRSARSALNLSTGHIPRRASSSKHTSRFGCLKSGFGRAR